MSGASKVKRNNSLTIEGGSNLNRKSIKFGDAEANRRF